MALLIGLTGPVAAGKSSVAKILSWLARENGVGSKYFSLSDEIREEARRQEILLEREALKQTADWFRSRAGNGVWALLVASRVENRLATVAEDEGAILVVVDSIRNPGEVHELRARFGSLFNLVGITAPPDVIQRNLQHRSRSDESRHLLADERALQDYVESEMGSGEPGFGHNVAACLKMADWPPIHNDGSFADLERKVRVLADRSIFPLLAAVAP